MSYWKAYRVISSHLRHSNSVQELLFKIRLSERRAKHINNSLFSSERKYWLLAHKHAREIVESINIRFIAGGRYSDLKWIHNLEQE